MRRRLIPLVAAALAAGLLTTPVAAAAPGPPITEHATTAGAAAAARASGKQVEALDQRTETTQVFAEPDGTMKLEQALSPVRVRKGDGWADIDTKLARQGAAVLPGATSVPVEFSAGGKTPVVRFGAPGKRFSLTWPKDLPAPVLDQETATYPEVFPGVDLKVVAKRDGFSHSLIVKTPEAAKNPELKTVRFGLRTEGISLRVEKTGALTAVDDKGVTVFQAPTPEMWDAGKQRRAVVQTGVTDGKLVLTPDQALLSDPATVFPVEIDPDWTPNLAGFGLVYAVPAAYRGNNYWNGDGDNIAKVGFSDYDVPKVHVRTYYQWDIRDLAGKQVLSASASFLESWSPSCTKRWVELYRTGAYDGSTSWNNQPGILAWQDSKEEAHGYNSNCPQDWVGFNVSGGVTAAVNEGKSSVTFMMKPPGATEEQERGDSYAWKKFKPWDTKLTVTYNRAPLNPSGLTGEPKPGCAQGTDEMYISTAKPIVSAWVDDPDGDRVQAQFEWRKRGNPDTPWTTTLTPQQDSGGWFRVQVDLGRFVGSGEKYEWRVVAKDTHGVWSGYSGPCNFIVDVTPPNKPPLVSSTLYPERGTGPDGGAPGQSGDFQFDANGVTDVAGFRYRLSGSDFRTVAAVGGKATARITPLTEDPHTLEVTSYDFAGNMGTEANTKKYEFRVGVPTPPTSHWRLDGHSDYRDLLDVKGTRNGTFPDRGAAWVSGRVGKALRNGTDGGFPVGTTRPLWTPAGFSVSAWVRLDTDPGAGFHTAVSQDGKSNSGYALGYHGDSRSWSFFMATRDGRNAGGELPNLDVALAPKATIGVWTQLTGVYNPSEQRIILYVDGIEAATAPHTTQWSADGPARFGGGQWDGKFGDTWSGSIDEVRTYSRTLSDLQVANATEIDKLAGTPAVPETTLAFDEGTGTTSTEVAGSFRQATLSGGASWGPGRNGTQGLVATTTGTATIEGTAVPSASSYTLSAWALPKTLDTSSQTVLSMDAAWGPSGTEVLYDGSRGKWVFRISSTSAADPGWYEAVSNGAPHPGWTHLAAVFDATTPELRLYADGVQIAAKRLPDKPFETVRQPGLLLRVAGSWAGRAAPGVLNQFRGSIDEVRVYRGVRTEDEIGDEYRYPLPDRTAGRALNRYVNSDVEFYTTNQPEVAGDYRLQAPLGRLVPVGTPGTRVVYTCLYGKDTFTSAKADCENQRVLGVLGALYVNPPADQVTRPIYRCILKTVKPGEHFESTDPGCEGNTQEALLGYSLAYSELARHIRVDGATTADHLTEVSDVPPGYRREGPVGLVSLVAQEGTVPLRLCRDGNDAFTSTDANCEGKTQVKVMGWIWAEPPAGLNTAPLYGCATNTWNERFDSQSETCEGQRLLGRIGYLATGANWATAAR
ncbi:LamG-like jellyroll fold domain-containing protein [Amycolatopsis sp. cg5]|uniref:LamG-like jellyroll fold domain-containing protein n=1 Tax=Amycolatopsis sp. cg5 TaxID=3238802 RepID=UPI00352670E1